MDVERTSFIDWLVVGLCNDALEGLIVTDELERGSKNSNCELFLNTS
jgi:hypothetical protein